MNILLTNDDGYQCVGLQIMTSMLSKFHNVYVVAPDGQRSSFGHHVHFHKPLRFTKVDDYFGANLCYITNGAPADCAKFGALRCGVKIDLLVSGPNNGENYGNDVLYSGTVGAAEEGVICGIKSIAISRLCFGNENYESCATFVVKNVEKIVALELGENLLNVNVPNLPYDKIKGVVTTKQGDNRYHDYYDETENGDLLLTGEKLLPLKKAKDDVWLSEKGYITVTPIDLKQTNKKLVRALKDEFIL